MFIIILHVQLDLVTMKSYGTQLLVLFMNIVMLAAQGCIEEQCIQAGIEPFRGKLKLRVIIISMRA